MVGEQENLSKPDLQSGIHSCQNIRQRFLLGGNRMTAEEYRKMLDTDFADVKLEELTDISLSLIHI